MEDFNVDIKNMTMYQALLLHSRADRALRLVVSRNMDKFNVTMMEWLLMGAVEKGSDDGVTMSEVASFLDVTLPQVTALTANLTKLKLVKQKVSKIDKRSRRLLNTSIGSKLLVDIENELNKALKEWVTDIPREQLASYLTTLNILSQRKPAESHR